MHEEAAALEAIPRTLMGAGSVLRLGRVIREGWGNSISTVALISGGSSFDRNPLSSRIIAGLYEENLRLLRFHVSGEPSPALVDRCVADIKKNQQEQGAELIVVGIGGGSVIDTAKAAAACATMEEPSRRYLEGVGDLIPTGTRLPFIAIPTTSGTGSEATKNSVLSSVGTAGFKKSMRHSALIPDMAMFDPMLLDAAPYGVTAPAGWDAVTQLLEAAVSTKATILTDLYSFAGLSLSSTAFPSACEFSKADGEDLSEEDRQARYRVRSDMALAAFYSGIALASAGLGLVHGAAGVLGGNRAIPHGVACGLLLPPVTKALTMRILSNDGKIRYAACGYLLSGHIKGREAAFSAAREAADSGIALLNETLTSWQRSYPLSRLSDYGFTEEELTALAAKASMKNSPAKLSFEELAKILTGLL
jgi:alcohol dehydrogenase class IV